MTSHRTVDDWARVEALLRAALERAPAERSAFLDTECGTDAALRDEVASLLAAHERGGAVDELAADLAPLTAQLGAPGATSMLGRTVGRYRVLAYVAGGGMGVVYEAVDERLGRTVALKFLHPRLAADDSAAERFRAEARAVAALEHPNVCTVHEIGETADGQLYLAMPRYAGETLQRRIAYGPLDVAQAVDVAVQIARGLTKAHAHGIVHRDVKPSNVFVTDDGVVKILDFGIAKLADVALTAPAAGPLGTVAYMSPEQLRGERVDARTDVWSLGVVLYELLTGDRPFDGDAVAAATLARIEHAEPVPPSARRPELPPALDAIVLRALAKPREARYASAAELERDLLALGLTTGTSGRAATGGAAPRATARAARVARVVAVGAVVALAAGGALWAARARAARDDVARGAAAPVPASAAAARSIVVLPFVDMTARAGDEYLSDGLTEEVTTRLAALPGLKVISRTSAMHYKGSSAPLRQIARELGVTHVLEGSVRESAGRLRVTAQLIDAGTDAHRWASTYDVRRRDVLGVQEEIAREVGRALEVELGAASASLARGTRDPEAYELYRRGRFLWGKRTKESHALAIRYYQQAIARDSSYADPYSGLADAYLTAFQFNLSTIPEAEVYSRIKWAAERALALDERSADAHASFAIALWWQRDWPGAERELRRAIELNPGGGPRQWHALLLSGMGRVNEALQQSRRSAELDPLGMLGGVNYAWLCYVARDYDCTVEQSRRALELNDAWAPTYVTLSLAYAQKGMDSAATDAAAKAVALGGRQISSALAGLAYAHARAGRRAEAERFLRRAKVDPWEGFNIARAYVALGEADSAFAWLDRSSWKWPHRAVRADPALDPLRGDPRFARLSARVDREMGLR